MNLIERYLHEVGRYLPAKTREDILAEIRSHLSETIEERYQGNATDEDIAALLKETGEPQKLAASYPGGERYLIGPGLFPFFKIVIGIVIAAVVGAQLLSIGIGIWAGEYTEPFWQSALSILSSIPMALGWVVLTFIILQRFGVQPKLHEGEWDPKDLPQVDDDEIMDKGERIAGIVFGSLILALLAAFPNKLGFFVFPGGTFFPNPVLMQNVGWLVLSLVASVGMDIYLLWQGRWTLASRVARIAVHLLSIGVLVILLQGHNAWLAAHGSQGFFQTLEKLGTDLSANIEIVGMEAFRMAFGIALIVTVIETIVFLVNLVRRSFKKNAPVIA